MSVFDRDAQDDVSRGTRALVVRAEVAGNQRREATVRLEEAKGLARAIGIDVRAEIAFRVRQVKPATLFGSGQVDQISEMMLSHGAELLIVDNVLSPVQQSNLEKTCSGKVIDRTGLILEIFGERAATNEGRLQVELAHLDYQAGRLVRSWTHLERQRGGFGFLGGPGETQIEADRRMIRDRMAKIRRELDQVTRTRSLHRARRQRAPWPVVALVGYTNAGKSTLFNRMTGAAVMAQDMLFATLDPTMRQISLPGREKAILSDTVGFVSDLPTQLIAAFRATLEEVRSADIIVHVRDVAHEDSEAQREDVLDVLYELGVYGSPDHRAEDESVAMPIYIEALNKADLLDADEQSCIAENVTRRDDSVFISALTGKGVADLTRIIQAKLTEDYECYHFSLSVEDGASLGWLYENGEILKRELAGGAMKISIRMSVSAYESFITRFNVRQIV